VEEEFIIDSVTRQQAFIVLLLTVFMGSFGVSMVGPILPIYVQSMGADGLVLALSFSAAAFSSILVLPFVGSLGDRYGRKPFLLFGIGVSVISATGYYFSDTILLIILFRVISGLGTSFWFALSSASVGDLSPPREEGKYMSILGVADLIGFGTGPLASGVIRDYFGFPAVFLGMGAVMLLVFLLIAVGLPKITSIKSVASIGRGVPLTAVRWRDVILMPLLQGLTLVTLGHAIAFGATLTFLALYLDTNLLFTATAIGMILTGQELVAGLLQPIFGRLADRYNRRYLIVLGILIQSIGILSLAGLTNFWMIFISFVFVGGFGHSLWSAAQRAALVVVGREMGMAKTMSFLELVFVSGLLLGSIGAGLLSQRVSIPIIFAICAGVILVGGVLFMIRSRGQQLSV
jgi:DHA1 family multidrug resistance protein-like MFS transporter